MTKKNDKALQDDPKALREWVRKDGSTIRLNGYNATIEKAAKLGWKPAA